MTGTSLYEQVLAMGLEAPKPRLRASAGVIPWRRTGAGVEIYWVERSRRLAFMGGFHAFPGGGLARSDAGIEAAGSIVGIENAPVDAAMPSSVLDGVDLDPIVVPGLAVCAVRELFEETGVLLVENSGDLDLDRTARLRRRLLDRSDALDFADVLSELGVRIDLSELSYAGRWLTPPLGPVRFDNRFFLLEWPAARAMQPTIIDGELTAGEWIRPREGLERWRTGEVVTAPPILHTLDVLAGDGIPQGLGRLRVPAEVNVGPFRRIEFRPGVLMFPLPTPTLPPASHTNAYVLGHKEIVLVDPGSPWPEPIEWLVSALRDLEKQGCRLTAIWLTHHHADHIGGVAEVRRAFDVPVAAHALTAERLASRGLSVDRELVDNELVVLAGEPSMAIRVLHTPGHASGHLAFYDERGGSLVGGDLTAGFGTLVIDPPEGNMDDYLASLARMRDLGASTLFPGHGPPTVEVRAKFEEYLEHRRWREEKILEAWQAGLREKELLERAYEDVPVQAYPLAARQLEAHLARLERLGRLK